MPTANATTTEGIIVSATGGPQVLVWGPLPVADPGPDEALIEHRAVGLNFIDVYQRSGLYPMQLPFTPGVEGAGIIIRVGSNVRGFGAGDRVAYATTQPVGSYCRRRVIPANRLVKLPDALSFETAAALMLKGCTTEYLIRRTYPVKTGDWVLWHAAAGGVGLLAMQWLRSLGAKIIGTVGSPEKAALAQANGCQHTILYRSENIATRVREITSGRGVDVVYDSVGKDTFEASLDCLRPRGLLVSFGNASGPVPAFAPLLLSQKGSLFFTRAGFKDYYSDPAEMAAGCAAVFEQVLSGKVNVAINQSFPLVNAADAHRALESRATTGASILTVDPQ